ncbi:MAG TPA: arginine deiminase family protein [Thermoleophilia bacterium]|nr:arginine deiminase family protein [Thermoleophilia bacterium]
MSAPAPGAEPDDAPAGVSPGPAASALPDGWGALSKTGVLKDVLLGRPDHYRWHPTSAISKATLANLATRGISFDLDLAKRQHAAMVETYEAAGVRVHLLGADRELPYGVFARDSSVMTPWGPVICSLQPAVRRRDHTLAARFYHDNGIPIWRWITAGYLEGGDVVVLEPGVVLIGYCEERSEKAGAEQLAGWFRDEGWETLVVAQPAHFVHMDATVLPAASQLVVVCPDALEDYVVDFLKAHRYAFVEVPYRDCVRLGCNIMPLGSERVLSLASNTALREKLTALGIDVLTVDLSMFALGGGGVHCLSMELRREA